MKITGMKRSGRSVQELMGIRSFTRCGLATEDGELVFYRVAPTNISVLSHANTEIKIRHLLMVLSALPDIEMVCTDSCECFDANKLYLAGRLEAEKNPAVRKVIRKDMDFLDRIQTEMSTARQFFFIARLHRDRPEQVFRDVNHIEKIISDQGFETARLEKDGIKRFLAIVFGAGMNGDRAPDADGEQYFETEALDDIPEKDSDA